MFSVLIFTEDNGLLNTYMFYLLNSSRSANATAVQLPMDFRAFEGPLGLLLRKLDVFKHWSVQFYWALKVNVYNSQLLALVRFSNLFRYHKTSSAISENMINSNIGIGIELAYLYSRIQQQDWEHLFRQVPNALWPYRGYPVKWALSAMLTCLRMAYRALLAGYPRYDVI